LLGLVLNATSGDELAELPRRRIQPVSHTGPVGNTGRIGQRLADVPRPGSDASRSPGPGTLHVWTVDRCGVILGLRLTNQPGPLRVPGWHSNSDKPRQARTRPRWCPPGGPGCSTAHDAPQTDADHTACLQAARAAQASTLHVRGVRQPAASAEAAAARASAGTTPTGRQATPHGHPTRRAGARALDASRQLPILGRRSEPGVFPSHLRVPPVRPAKHHPHHYRRGNQAAKPISTHHHRLIPTPNGASLNPGHGPCPLPITRPAMPARYGPARYRPARYGVTTLTARGRPARQRSAHS
jgi:hypothetical protein